MFQVAEKVMLDNYMRTFGCWQYLLSLDGEEYHQNHITARQLPHILNQVVMGYMDNGDYESALELLASTQYSGCIPSISIIRKILWKLSTSPNKDSIFDEQLQLFAEEQLNSGQWDSALLSLIEYNWLQGEPGAESFWMLFASIETTSHCVGNTMRILSILLKRLWINGLLERLVQEGLRDRRLRRRFISMQLVSLFELCDPLGSQLIPEMISMV